MEEIILQFIIAICSYNAIMWLPVDKTRLLGTNYSRLAFSLFYFLLPMNSSVIFHIEIDGIYCSLG